MFMSVVELKSGGQFFPELAGARVLVTGVTSASGVDLLRALAEHKARLVIQSPEASPAVTALAAVLAETAGDITLYNDPLPTGSDAVRLAQTASQVHGGLDAVVNLAAFDEGDLTTVSSYAEIETLVAGKLLGPTLITRIVANRMRLTLTEGSILNVVTCPPPRSEGERAIAGIIRSALATLTRGEATAWAGEAIRINAIGPRGVAGDAVPGAVLTSEPDIAFLALYLASRRGRQLSGHIFDAEGVARRRC